MKFKYKLQFKIQFLWYDFWIGFFFDKDKHKLYICPFPCIVLSFWLKPNYKNMSREEGINCLKKRVQQRLKSSSDGETTNCSTEEIAKQMKQGVTSSQRIPVKFAEKVHAICEPDAEDVNSATSIPPAPIDMK